MAMTASSFGSAAVMASMNVPQTQNTAPVLEFRCLFTQDLRRKQKRWQDGRVKFHTFNKRIMAYDERSNLLGDAHWRGDAEFGEGEEVELERGGILVEVGECVGRRDQDLTELVDKRHKDKEERAAAKANAATPSRSFAPRARTQGTPAPYLLHKPLNNMLTPSGHYGRAMMPITSPFEDRERLASAPSRYENEPPKKRRRENETAPSRSGYAQNLMGATLSLGSQRPTSTATIHYAPVRAVPSTRPEPIDLTLDDDHEPGKIDNGSSKDRAPVARISRVQKWRQKSPPRNGYASNLTGATITLSRPASTQESYAIRPQLSAPPSIRRPEEPNDPRLSVEPQSTHIRTSVAKPVKRSRTETAKQPTISPEASSPPFSESCSPIPKPVERPTRNSPIPSVAHVGRNQSLSGLKIKSRPARKMMMLMDRSNVKVVQSHSNSSPGSRTTASDLNAQIRSDEVVLSQATVRLNAFCKKQDEKLQARMNRSKAPKAFVEAEELHSSLEDNGIDHTTIDKLLSRRDDSEPSASHTSILEALPTKEHNAIQASTDSTSEPMRTTPSTSEPLSRCSDVVKRRLVTTQNAATCSLDIDPRCEAGNRSEPSEKRIECLTNRSQSEQNGNGQEKCPVNNTLSNTEQPLRPADMRADPLTNVGIQAKPHEREAKALYSPPTSPLEDVSQSPTRHHTESKANTPLPLSSDPMAHTPDTRRPSPNLAQAVVQEQPKAIAQSSSASIEIMTKAQSSPSAALKGSPDLSPVILDISPLGPGTWADVEATPTIDMQYIPEAPAVQANELSEPQFKVRLVNPATKGKSVHTLAASTTVDVIVPAFNPMAPPPMLPQRTSVRREVVYPESRTAWTPVSEKYDGPIKATAGIGPWSRESFDLFGNWKPPQKEGGLAS